MLSAPSSGELLGPVRIGLDFDGSLAERAPGGGLRWRAGAQELVLGAAADGAILVLHTCRATWAPELPGLGDSADFYRVGAVPPEVEISWALYLEMRQFLQAEGVWGLLRVWSGPGKPRCDHFVDDKAELPNWPRISAELGIFQR